MARKYRREDVDITKDELNQIKEALKQEEFRKLFIDYVDEINDPANKALYEKEIKQYERERGIDATFIHPIPGYVIKTSADGAKKAFINVCGNENIGKPSAVRGVQEGSSGFQWSLPYIQAPPRDDLDKNRQLCLVFDVIFNPLTLELAKKDARLKSFLNDTALNAVESNFGVVLDRNNLKFPKLDFKGYKHPCVIRKRISPSDMPGTSDVKDDEPIDDLIPNHFYPYSEPVEEAIVCSPKPSKKSDEDPYTVPKYQIKHRKNLDMQEFTLSTDCKMNACVANELLIEIDLPLIKSVSDVDLRLSEKTLNLKTESPAKYKLEIKLPYSILEDESSAKFDGSKRKLLVNTTVDRPKHCLNREDSGLESDPSRGMSSSSDEDVAVMKYDDKTGIKRNTKSVDSINEPPVAEHKIVDSDEREEFLSLDLPEEMETESEPFLNPDHYYSLPSYTLNKTSIGVTSHLSAQNIEPSSVFHLFSENNSQFQVKFYSMGLGFVLINYSVCMKLKSSNFDPTSLNIDICDDFVSISISVIERNTCDIHSINVGRDPSSLKEEPLPELSPTNSEVCLKSFRGADEGYVFDDSGVKKSGDIILKLSKLRLYSTAQDDSDDSDEDDMEEPESDNIPDQILSVSGTSLGCSQNMPSVSQPIRIDKKIRRTFSESGTPLPLIQRRSILKDTRSLSESSANDYTVFSQSMESEDGFSLQENGHIKKHVRFSETISKKVFRSNSSILGQRKKNQKKAKNKQRTDRTNSESSGISESDVSEFEISEVSDLSEVSDVSETSESDDGSAFEARFAQQIPGSKSHRRKGKKNLRKSANTAKMQFFYNES